MRDATARKAAHIVRFSVPDLEIRDPNSQVGSNHSTNRNTTKDQELVIEDDFSFHFFCGTALHLKIFKFFFVSLIVSVVCRWKNAPHRSLVLGGNVCIKNRWTKFSPHQPPDSVVSPIN
jgi:hypothetical protein